MAEACSNCRFWDVYKEVTALDFGEAGDCRRRAPRISDELLRRTLPGPSCDQFDTLPRDLYIPSSFPVTASDSWCGEYERRGGELPIC